MTTTVPRRFIDATPSDPGRAAPTEGWRIAPGQLPTLPDLPPFAEARAAIETLNDLRRRAGAAHVAAQGADAALRDAQRADSRSLADALREGRKDPGPTHKREAEARIAEATRHRDALRLAVADAQRELERVLDAQAPAMLAALDEMLDEDRAAALQALEGYVAARGTLDARLALRRFLRGQKGTRGLDVIARRGMSADSVLDMLRAELEQPEAAPDDPRVVAMLADDGEERPSERVASAGF